MSDLHEAVTLGEVDCVENILPYVDVNQRNIDNETAIHLAVRYNQIEIMKILVGNSRVDVNLCCNGPFTPLQLAVLEGRVGHVKLLLARCDLDLDTQCIMGVTALHLAVFTDSLEIVKILVKRGALLCLCDDKGRVPYDWAVYYGRAEIVEYLTNL